MFRIGDKVRVIRKVESAPGWRNCWVDKMDLSIGKVLTVLQEDNGYGVELDDGRGYKYGYKYPNEALIPVNRGQQMMMFEL